jgi:lipoprotein-anchoring transpeptidase ErfK/SrfK
VKGRCKLRCLRLSLFFCFFLFFLLISLPAFANPEGGLRLCINNPLSNKPKIQVNDENYNYKVLVLKTPSSIIIESQKMTLIPAVSPLPTPSTTIQTITPVSTITPQPTMTPEPTTTPQSTMTPEPTAPQPIMTSEPTTTPQPTITPKPTATPQPIITPKPTATPQPTVTPKPTTTPQPTVTPKPTTTPQPAITPRPTIPPKKNSPPLTNDSIKIRSLENFIANKNLKSDNKYLIWVDTNIQRVHIFNKVNEKWVFFKTFVCTVGKDSTPTIKGIFKTQAKAFFAYDKRYNCYLKYVTKIYQGYLFHSVILDKDGKVIDGTLGKKKSHGCIRLSLKDSEWLYKTLPLGTTVFIN